MYAHVATREALLDAVQQRALAQAVAAIDAAHPDEGPPATRPPRRSAPAA